MAINTNGHQYVGNKRSNPVNPSLLSGVARPTNYPILARIWGALRRSSPVNPSIRSGVTRPTNNPIAARVFGRLLRSNPANASLISGANRAGSLGSIRTPTGGWGQVCWADTGRDNAIGNTAPGLKVGCGVVLRFALPVSAGTRTLTVDAYQNTPSAARPFVRLKANPSIGIPADITSVAGANTGWIAIGAITLAPTFAGGVWVELWNPARYPWFAYFDNLKLS